MFVASYSVKVEDRTNGFDESVFVYLQIVFFEEDHFDSSFNNFIEPRLMFEGVVVVDSVDSRADFEGAFDDFCDNTASDVFAIPEFSNGWCDIDVPEIADFDNVLRFDRLGDVGSHAFISFFGGKETAREEKCEKELCDVHWLGAWAIVHSAIVHLFIPTATCRVRSIIRLA